MRFWGKGKQGDKKSSRDRLVCGSDTLEGDYGDTGLLLGGKALEQFFSGILSSLYCHVYTRHHFRQSKKFTVHIFQHLDFLMSILYLAFSDSFCIHVPVISIFKYSLPLPSLSLLEQEASSCPHRAVPI